MILTFLEAVAKYGPIVDDVWAAESQWCISYAIPAPIILLNCNGGVQKHVYGNKDMLPALDRVFSALIAKELQDQLKTFDGCYMVRDIRGEPGKVSTHAYALALDFNAATNQLGCEPTMNLDVVACFKAEGFQWGGDFSRKDGMHFQFANW